MQTLELIDQAHGPRMVRLVLDGRKIEREFGPVGGSLIRREDRFADETTAEHTLDKWLIKLQVGGYRLGEHSPELIAEIAREPTKLDTYLVYADWLSERGDPRGELISAMIAREQQPERDELAAWELGLRSEHVFRFERRSWRGLELAWRWGFVEGMRAPFGTPRNLAVGQSVELHYKWGMNWIEQQLNSLYNHPSGRFVRRVVEDQRSFHARRLDSGKWLLTRESDLLSGYARALTAG